MPALDFKICGLIGSITLRKSPSFNKISRTHKQEYDIENHLDSIFFKGLLKYILSPQESGASAPVYKLRTSFPCTQVPYIHPSFDLLLTALFNFFPVNTLGPLEGTRIVLGTMQFTKWCSGYGNARKHPWWEKLSKYILILL